ncbi:MAG: FAD-binding protein, partial [Pseudomonadota bacterium]
MTIHKPASEEEAASLVADLAASGTSVRIKGGGTRSSIGRAIETGDVLSSEAVSGISLYEPGEMVISAKAGTPVAEIEKALSDSAQMLTFEPMDHRALLGTEGEPTIGAVVAGNVSGPRRIFAGAARDSLIGVRFVNGKGEIVKNGGRVMKNVTGLDLVKLQAGAWGTLGFLTEVTFKLLPTPQESATLVFSGLDNEKGVQALCAAAGTPFEATGLAHLPALITGSDAQTVMRVEGFAEQVDYRLNQLSDALSEYGSPERLRGEDHKALWRNIRDATFIAEPRDRAVWRLSVRPTSAPNVVEVIKQAVDCRYFFDWCGGLIWISVPEDDDAGEETVRNAANAADGYATLVRGSEPLRRRVSVFEPEPAPLDRLSAGIKQGFDPKNVFNPGLMAA